MAAQNAKFCTAVSSHWILMAILMCDETLSVWFKHGICVNYRGSNVNHYRQMVAAASPVRWLHRNLYRILPYKIIPLPCPAAGCTIQNTCCPGISIPQTLHGTNLHYQLHPNQNIPLTYQTAGTVPGDGVSAPFWQGSGTDGLIASLWCTSGATWDLELYYGAADYADQTPTSVNCNPIDLVWIGSFGAEITT